MYGLGNFADDAEGGFLWRQDKVVFSFQKKIFEKILLEKKKVVILRRKISK